MINSISTGYGAHQIDHTARNSYAARQQSRQPGTQDTVSLSSAGKLMSSFFSGLGIDFTSGKSISLDDLEKGLQEQKKELETDINSLFFNNGIKVPPEVKLTSDENGHVRVEGDHPQSEQIEKLFADNPDLENDFKKVSGLSSMVNAGHEHVDFANQYKKNPYAAVAQYGDRLFGKDAADSFVLTVGESISSSSQINGKSVQEQKTNTGISQPGETEPSAGTVTETDSVSGIAGTSSAIDFTNATRKEVFDWMNNEIRAGRMSLDDSSPFMGMTLKVSVATGQSADMESDSTHINFMEKALLGLEAAETRNDFATARQLRSALNIMNTTMVKNQREA
ncbi:hypothetical protein [Maridesulfovibrio sp.]|uniref:hypothetical protein n=1 Tax=Maridesulfovibrio sp. TaxID=2795000 RepID=UPI0039EE0BB5